MIADHHIYNLCVCLSVHATRAAVWGALGLELELPLRFTPADDDEHHDETTREDDQGFLTIHITSEILRTYEQHGHQPELRSRLDF